MPRSETQNEQMRAATRQTLLDTGMRLFAENGYAHTSTRRIAKEAGISAGLLYHYFDSKESLLRAVVEHSIAVIDERLLAEMEAAPPPLLLTRVLHGIFDLLESEANFWAFFYMLRSQPMINRELGDFFRQRTRDLRGYFEARLGEYGRENPTLDAYVLYCLVEGTIQQYLLEPESYPLEAVVARILEQFELPTE